MICPACSAEFSDALECCPVCGWSALESEHLYQIAIYLMNHCHTPLGYKGISVVLNEISDYKDAREKAEECIVRSRQLADAGESVENNADTGRNSPKSQKKPSRPASIIGIAVCIAILISIATTIGNAYRIKKALVKEWYALEDSIVKVMDIRDDEMEYRLETGIYWLNTTVATFDWKPGFGNKIKVKLVNDYSTYRIKFNDEKTMLTIYPAITSTDSFENWYCIND